MFITVHPIKTAIDVTTAYITETVAV